MIESERAREGYIGMDATWFDTTTRTTATTTAGSATGKQTRALGPSSLDHDSGTDQSNIQEPCSVSSGFYGMDSFVLCGSDWRVLLGLLVRGRCGRAFWIGLGSNSSHAIIPRLLGQRGGNENRAHSSAVTVEILLCRALAIVADALTYNERYEDVPVVHQNTWMVSEVGLDALNRPERKGSQVVCQVSADTRAVLETTVLEEEEEDRGDDE
eukprot:jgi/Picre1/31716/NNA_007067.t1